MSFYGELTTVAKVRGKYLNTTSTTDDVFLLDQIRDVTREAQSMTNRQFHPTIETRYYDTPDADKPLHFDQDCLEITTLTNGDGDAISTADYKLKPYNAYPKHQVVILASSSDRWETTTKGDPEAAIIVSGIWGWHKDYGNAWQDVGATLTGAVNSTATSASVTSSLINPGNLCKIGSEYVYVSAVTTSTTDTLTIKRAVNGSTAAAMTSGATVYVWTVDDDVANLAARCAVGYYNLRSNPMLDSVTLDGVTWTTPKDIQAYLSKQLDFLGVTRLGFG